MSTTVGKADVRAQGGNKSGGHRESCCCARQIHNSYFCAILAAARTTMAQNCDYVQSQVRGQYFEEIAGARLDA